jgi:PAS domain S-box-containing protein
MAHDTLLSLAADQRRTHAPKLLIWVIVGISVSPFLLQLCGINFASSAPPFDAALLSASASAPSQAIAAMHRSLAGSFTHTILEWSAFCAAFFTVVLAFVHFRTELDAVTPIIAVSLFCAGCMDAFHTIAADHLLGLSSGSRNLIPFTWAICRLFNALIPIACVGLILLRGTGSTARSALYWTSAVSVTLGVAAYSIIRICATSTALPETMFPDSLITRPWDVAPLLLYIVSGLSLYPWLYRRRKNSFTLCLWLSVIPATTTQLHMSFGSTQLFDSHFNVAHFLKIVAYLVPLGGLILDHVHMHRRQIRTNTELEGLIRDRTQSEEALRESESRLQTILDSVDFGIIIANAGTNVIVGANPTAAAMIGEAPGSLIGQSFRERIRPNDPETQLTDGSGQPSAGSSCLLVTRDGRETPILETIAPVMLDGEPHVLQSFVDITDRIRIEERLRESSSLLSVSNAQLEAHRRELESQRRKLLEINVQLRDSKSAAEAANHAKSVFLATMSHEIRTPMTAIVGYSDLLARSDGRSSPFARKSAIERKQWVKQIGRNAEHLVSLINDILDLSKIEAGQMALQRTRHRLVPIIEGVHSLMNTVAAEKLIRFDLVFSSRIPEYIQTDSVRFRQILINLVANALKFTDSGSVTICVGVLPAQPPEAPQLSIAVEDTGIGIEEERIPLLFSPFSQVHDSKRYQYSGAGLGLDISRRLARLLGGDISVVSEFGDGSTFTLTLPTDHESTWIDAPNVDRDAPTTQPILESTRSLNLESVRVLCVDDNPDNQSIISFLLEEVRASVELAPNGAEGLETVLRAAEAGRPFGLILMDMRMPVMDGYTATARLRESGITTPIIALTAHAMTGDEERCLQAGCDAYIGKPIVPRLLFDAIEQHLPAQSNPTSPPKQTRILVSSMAGVARFAPVLQKYIASMPGVVKELRLACDSQNADALRTLAHRLHGTATSYGFPAITEAAGECEAVLRTTGSTQDVEEHVALLVKLLEQAAASVEGMSQSGSEEA